MEIISIYKNFVNGFEPLKSLLGKAYSYSYDKAHHIHENIEKVKSVIEQCEQSVYEESIEYIMRLSHNIVLIKMNMNSCILNIKEMFGNQSELSNTYVLNVEDDMRHIIEHYEQISGSVAILEKELYDKHREIITKNTDIERVDLLYQHNPNAVVVYCIFLQSMIDRGIDLPLVYNKLESAKYGLFKNDILEETNSTTKNDKSDNGKHKNFKEEILQTFGLVPVWINKNANEILKITMGIITQNTERDPEQMYGGGDSIVDKLEAVSDALATKGIGLIIMLRINKKYAKYNFSTLIDRDHIIKISKSSGINDLTIKKFSNIEIGDSGIDSNWQNSNVKMGLKNAKRWVILRTLDGRLYDIMGFNKKSVIVDSVFASKLDRGNSDLINGYQTMANDKIFEHIKTPTEIVMDTDGSLDDVRTMVFIYMSDYIDNVLKTKSESIKKVHDLLETKKIEKIVEKSIVNEYTKMDTNAETDITFLAGLYSIKTEFVKYVFEEFSKSKTAKKYLGRVQDIEFTNKMRGELLSIVRSAMDKTFDPSKNIFQKILIKKRLYDINKNEPQRG